MSENESVSSHQAPPVSPAWARIERARHPQRPYPMELIERIFTDFSEIHGDRAFGDDEAVACGMARLGGEEVMVIGNRKGGTTKERVRRNFGMPHPEGYRKALRTMKIAEKFGRPVFSFIDLPGAYPGLGAEERGQAEAIARNLVEMARLRVPTISVITGEGGSGGALALAVADRVLILENALYFVITPESCAAIMWRDAAHKEKAAEAMRISAPEVAALGCVDEIVREPPEGIHMDREAGAATLGSILKKHLAELKAIPIEKLVEQRQHKFRNLAQFYTEELKAASRASRDTAIRAGRWPAKGRPGPEVSFLGVIPEQQPSAYRALQPETASGSGKSRPLRSYTLFVAAVFYYFLARSIAHHSADGFAGALWSPLLEQAMLVFLLLVGYGGMGILFQRQAHPVADQGLPLRAGWPREFSLGLATGWGIAILCVIPLTLMGGIAIIFSGSGSEWGWFLVDTAFFLLATLAEEIAFRGYAFQRFMDAVGPLGAALGFSLYYGAVQMLVPGSNRVSFVVSMVLGLLLSTAYIRTRALWVSWGINFGWRASRALLFGLVVAGVGSHSSVIEGDLMGPFWLTGGGFGLDGTWLAFFVVLAAFPVLVRVTHDLDFRYNAPIIIPGGIPVDLDAAARAQHESAMGSAPAPPPLVQIAAAPPAPVEPENPENMPEPPHAG